MAVTTQLGGETRYRTFARAGKYHGFTQLVAAAENLAGEWTGRDILHLNIMRPSLLADDEYPAWLLHQIV